MNLLEKFQSQIPAMEEKIGYLFQNKELIIRAFTHRSFVNESKGMVLVHNERLEFLGDSVLGLIVSEYLYHLLPTYPEGQLSQLRSQLVDAASCASYLQQLQFADAVLLGRGERIGGTIKMSILADTFEALVGALYSDGGMSVVKTFMLQHFEEQFLQVIDRPPRNYKAELQDYSQKKIQKAPIYKVVQETGPDHSKQFHVLVFIGDEQVGAGFGLSKKQAEQQAALDAMSRLELS